MRTILAGQRKRKPRSLKGSRKNGRCYIAGEADRSQLLGALVAQGESLDLIPIA